MLAQQRLVALQAPDATDRRFLERTERRFGRQVGALHRLMDTSAVQRIGLIGRVAHQHHPVVDDGRGR